MKPHKESKKLEDYLIEATEQKYEGKSFLCHVYDRSNTNTHSGNYEIILKDEDIPKSYPLSRKYDQASFNKNYLSKHYFKCTRANLSFGLGGFECDLHLEHAIYGKHVIRLDTY